MGSRSRGLTVGVGAGVPMVYALYQPRLLAGTLTRDDIDDGARHGTVGMRNALGLHMLLDMFSLEVGHQFMSAGGGLEHDVHVLIGTNPAAAVFLFGKMLDGLRL
ncbi:MAG: hypothetical protein HY908_00720 [Myxococcales bacterium]|nr:hypothetical protein [Myxococcales bacterium]